MTTTRDPLAALRTALAAADAEAALPALWLVLDAAYRRANLLDDDGADLFAAGTAALHAADARDRIPLRHAPDQLPGTPPDAADLAELLAATAERLDAFALTTDDPHAVYAWAQTAHDTREARHALTTAAQTRPRPPAPRRRP